MTTPREEESLALQLLGTEQDVATLTQWWPMVDVFVNPNGQANALGSIWTLYSVANGVRAAFASGVLKQTAQPERVVANAIGSGNTIVLAVRSPKGATSAVTLVTGAVVGYDPTFQGSPEENFDSATQVLDATNKIFGTLASYFPRADVIVNGNAQKNAMQSVWTLYAIVAGFETPLAAGSLNDPNVEQPIIRDVLSGAAQYRVRGRSVFNATPGNVSASVIGYAGGAGGGGGGGGLTVTANFPVIGDPGIQQKITVLGSGFKSGTPIVSINGVNCVGVVVQDDGRLSCLTPASVLTPQAPGVYPVEVTIGGQNASGGSFEYWNLLQISDCEACFPPEQVHVMGSNTIDIWSDVSGHGRNIAQATPANQPNSINGSQDEGAYAGWNFSQWAAPIFNSQSLQNAAIPLNEPYTVVILGTFNGGLEAIWAGQGAPFPYLQYNGGQFASRDTGSPSEIDANTPYANEPLFIADIRDGASSALWIKGVKQAFATGTDGGSNTTGFVLGNIAAGGLGLNGSDSVVFAAVFSKALSKAEITKIQQYFQARFTQGVNPANPTTDVNFVFSGASVSAGFFAFGIGANDHVGLTLAGLSDNCRGVNVAISGATVPAIETVGLNKQDSSRYQIAYLGEDAPGNSIMIDGDDGPTTLALYETWNTNFQLSFDAVCLSTLLPRTAFTAPNNVAKNFVNTSLMTGAVAPMGAPPLLYFRADLQAYVLDEASIPELTDPTNTLYYQDGTHLTTLGHAVLASYVLPAMQFLADLFVEASP